MPITSGQQPSPAEITRKGEEIYINELKDRLESSHNGEYVIIDIDSKEYFVNKDLVVALEEARKKFPGKLFFIVQIGTLQKSSINLKIDKHEWLF